jgi:hypothetical protein
VLGCFLRHRPVFLPALHCRCQNLIQTLHRSIPFVVGVSVTVGESGRPDGNALWSALLQKNTGPGAQTERRGEAGPVWALLGGKTPPAACFCKMVPK